MSSHLTPFYVTNAKSLARQSPFHFACCSADFYLLNKILIDFFFPNNTYNDQTALMFACYFNQMEVIKRLCEFPCDVFQLNKNKENCLFVSAIRGHYDVVKYLCMVAREKPTKTNVEKDILANRAESRKKRRAEQVFFCERSCERSCE
mgnify:FL=1